MLIKLHFDLSEYNIFECCRLFNVSTYLLCGQSLRNPDAIMTLCVLAVVYLNKTFAFELENNYNS